MSQDGGKRTLNFHLRVSPFTPRSFSPQSISAMWGKRTASLHKNLLLAGYPASRWWRECQFQPPFSSMASHATVQEGKKTDLTQEEGTSDGCERLAVLLCDPVSRLDHIKASHSVRRRNGIIRRHPVTVGLYAFF